MKRIRFTWVAYAIMICSLTTFAQPDTVWTRTYGIGGNPEGLFQADDGGALLVTNLSVGIYWTFRVSRFSSSGDSIWSHTYEDSNYSGACVSASLLANGNVIVLADSIFGEGPLDEVSQRLYEISQDGNVVRVVQFSDNVNWNRVSSFPDGGYILQGVLWSQESDSLVLARIRANGDTAWTTTYSEPELYPYIWDIQVNEFGRTLVVGALEGQIDNVFHYDGLIAVVDSSGEFLWDTVYPFDDIGNLAQLFAGAWTQDGIYVCGNTDQGPGNPGWVVKLNFEGDSLWSRTIPGSNSPNSIHIVESIVTDNGDFIGVGNSWFPNEPYLVKVSATGELLWQDCCPETPYNREFNSQVLVFEDGSYLIAGYAYDVFSDRVIRLTRTTPDIVSTSPTGELPSSIVLHANYPNPFNASTEITFDLPRVMPASLKVYDVLGREVAELAGGVMNAGSHTIIYDASGLSSGVYFYRLEAGEFGETRKMVFLK